MVIAEDGSIVELEGQAIEPEVHRAEIVQHTTPAPAQPVRVVEVIATDYIWNEQARGFFPVFGAMHAGEPFLVKETEHERKQTALARARHEAARLGTNLKRLLK